VRHPSYTGLQMYAFGVGLCLFGSGSWWWKTTFGSIVGCAFWTWHIGGVPMFIKRGKTEDKVLQMTFGDEWTRWAERTPYAMFPYVV